MYTLTKYEKNEGLSGSPLSPFPVIISNNSNPDLIPSPPSTSPVIQTHCLGNKLSYYDRQEYFSKEQPSYLIHTAVWVHMSSQLSP